MLLELKGTHLDHAFGEVRQLRDMDTDTLVAHARFHLVEQGDIAIAAAFLRVGDVGDHMEVLDMRNLLIEGGQLMEVRCKQAESVDLRRNMPTGRSEHSQSIKTEPYSEIPHASPKPS